jgi:uncharacterized protein YdiU (UPF0061 family)
VKRDIKTLDDLAYVANYSFVDNLNPDPHAKEDGLEHNPREVFSGHYVLVKPTPIASPIYIAHSYDFFKELGFADSLATSDEFIKMFSGDTSSLPNPLRKLGWATGYALSIYGTEYYDQCPFKTGNGYGDGRAISILEVVIDGKRYEMQLKGGGRTPYCRGADGRAVLRSSIREFLAQEHMHSLGVPTSRSLSLYVSAIETVSRPWFLNGSYSKNPEVMIEENVAISTRVAPSFIRVGQLELHGRRARKKEHPDALKELEMIVLHLIEREYSDEIDANLPLEKKVVLLAQHFQERLTSLVADWIRVGYCQGNFNSDNCATGGYTLDYGPFGFIDMFEPRYQPWTGGGVHFSFLNQPNAAEENFHMFYTALLPLMQPYEDGLKQLKKIRDEFSAVMEDKMMQMWASKLGLKTLDAELFNELITLMMQTSVDYTIFFRELSNIPDDISALSKSFYGESYDEKILNSWSQWLERWRVLINADTLDAREDLSKKMKMINPKYTLREWILVPAYKAAENSDFTLVRELQEIMTNPYAEHTCEIEKKYYSKKPSELFHVAGVSHISCSS